MTDIRDLLGTRDEGITPTPSLFDGTPLDAVARKVINLQNAPGRPPKRRPWVADPLRVAFGITNLTGRSRPAPLPRQEQLEHRDAILYAIEGLGSCPQSPRRADESALDWAKMGPDAWNGVGHEFGEAALASAAFPLALPPRSLLRHARGNSGTNQDTMAVVDGGITDNQPVDLAQAALQSAGVTFPAILAVACGLEPPPAGPKTAHGWSILETGKQLLSAVFEEARLATPATPPHGGAAPAAKVHVVAPDDTHPLAGNFLGGFGGYLSVDFRRHDFLLGRHDAQCHLARNFTLPATNPLFQDWSDGQRRQFMHGYDLPIVPLLGELHPTNRVEPLPTWPERKVDLDALKPLLAARLELLYWRAVDRSWWHQALYVPWRLAVRPLIVSRIAGQVEAALRAAKLA